MENKPTFKYVTNAEYNAAKEAGQWPLATIVAIKSDFPGSDGQIHPFWFEVVTNLDSSWVVKDGKDSAGRFLEGDALNAEVHDIKHALWACVDVLHTHRLTVMEHGCHIFGFDDGKAETVAGAVAAWCRNPKFVALAPREGWVNVLWRNGHYVAREPLGYDAETKHDYEDMILTGSANFHLEIPIFLQKWADTVVEALSLSAEDSVAKSRLNLGGWQIRQDTNGKVTGQIANGSLPEVGTVTLLDKDGNTLPLAQVKPGTLLYFYRKLNGVLVLQPPVIAWDGSARRLGTVADYSHKGFVVSLDTPLEQ